MKTTILILIASSSFLNAQELEGLNPIPVLPAPQVVYISNLSETDGRKSGDYYTITPLVQYPTYTSTSQSYQTNKLK